MLKSNVLDYESKLKSMHAPIDRREAERALIHYRVTYTGGEGARLVLTEGSLRNLSKTGCRILGTLLPVSGSLITVTLYLEDGKAPLKLDNASVSWIKGSMFAIRFPKLSSEERKRLQDVILRHITFSPSQNERKAFRIAL